MGRPRILTDAQLEALELDFEWLRRPLEEFFRARRVSESGQSGYLTIAWLVRELAGQGTCVSHMTLHRAHAAWRQRVAEEKGYEP